MYKNDLFKDTFMYTYMYEIKGKASLRPYGYYTESVVIYYLL